MKIRYPLAFAGVGSYVPEEVVPNQYFIDRLDTTEEWIVTRTGIRERRRAAKGEMTSVLALHAARKALQDAGKSAAELDLIIVATATGDCQFPATATFLQQELGCENTPAFDVGAACAGFLHATAVAAGLLASGMYKTILVVGAETLSRFLDPEDRATVILLGDGAGAAVLTRPLNPEQGVLYSELGCDGTKTKLIWVPAGGSLVPASTTSVAERLHYMHMKGREVYKFAVTKMQEMVDRALTETGLQPDDLKLVIPHQSNLRIIESVREKLGLPKEKIAVNIDRYGNTSAASVPIALDEARHRGIVKTGDHILMLALGAGLVWGTMIVRL